jgi:hypothetical protein
MPAQTGPVVKNKKRYYSFETKLRHHCRELNKAEKKLIPRSTLSYWTKSNMANDFKSNSLWEKLDDIEPAYLIFENRKLVEHNVLLAHAAMGLSAIAKNTTISGSDKNKLLKALIK